MALKLWLPKNNNVGHLSMELDDGTYISFWPADEKMRFEDLFKSLPPRANTYEEDVEDEGRTPDKTLRLPSGLVDQGKISSWWQTYIQKSRYSLICNNCALVVKTALHVGGIAKYAHAEKTMEMTHLGIYNWAKKTCTRFLRKNSANTDIPLHLEELEGSSTGNASEEILDKKPLSQLTFCKKAVRSKNQEEVSDIV